MQSVKKEKQLVKKDAMKEGKEVINQDQSHVQPRTQSQTE